MKKYRLYELSDEQFQSLTGKVCVEILGTGTFVFASGPDGGRDARFEGTARKFPSDASPISGKIIAQAKHTSNAAASVANAEFVRILDQEEVKVRALVASGELDHYLLFTNRRVPAGQEKRFRARFAKIEGLKSAYLLGTEWIEQNLDINGTIWKSLGYDRLDIPLRISPKDLGDVITAFYKSKPDISTSFDSARDFQYVKLKQKNRINGLSKEYFEYIQRDSMGSFGQVKAFLENPRNEILRDQYHSTADEMKAKLIEHRDSFDSFDQVLTYLYDLVVSGNPELKHKRRLAHVFLHYMYCNCDIGKHA